MEINDSEILNQLKKLENFEAGFKSLVHKYQEPLYWHIRRMVHFHEDSNDILQNVFIKVYKGIHSFREDSKLYTWLYRIATNESLNFLKKNKMKFDGSVDHLIGLKEDPYFSGDQIQYYLKLAIEQLPMKQKQVFIMRYYDELPYQSISEIVDTSVGALKASYHHAVKKIENYLKETDVFAS